MTVPLSLESRPYVERCGPRYHVNPDYQVRVVLRRDARPNQEITGRVLDLSLGGARLVLSEPAQFQEAITVFLGCPEMGLNLEMCGQVCWLRQGQTSDEWILGCAFDPEMPQSCLDEFFRNGLLDRRTAQRTPLDLAARAQWELETDTVSVRVVNVSQCGFCLKLTQGAEVDRRVRLFTDRQGAEPLQIEGRIQWMLQDGEEYIVGCHLISGSGYDTIPQLLALVQEAQKREQPKKAGAGRLCYYLVVTALAALAAILLHWFGAV